MATPAGDAAASSARRCRRVVREEMPPSSARRCRRVVREEMPPQEAYELFQELAHAPAII